MLRPEEVFTHISESWKYITYDYNNGWVAHLDKPAFQCSAAFASTASAEWRYTDKGRTQALRPLNITRDHMMDEKDCIWERKLTFKELKLGEFFRYVGDTADTKCVKINNSDYARLECHSLFSMMASTPVRRIDA